MKSVKEQASIEDKILFFDAHYTNIIAKTIYCPVTRMTFPDYAEGMIQCPACDALMENGFLEGNYLLWCNFYPTSEVEWNHG